MAKGAVKGRSGPGRLNREDWLDAALGLVVRTGIQGLRVEELAETLGATTGSLYWHFRNRSELLDALLDHWVRRSTQEVVDRVLAADATPEEQLYDLLRQVLDNAATTSDLAFRTWARASRRAAAAVARVDRLRAEAAGKLFAALGFEGLEQEVRVRLLLCYESCERVVFPRLSRRERLALLEARHALLCQRLGA